MVKLQVALGSIEAQLSPRLYAITYSKFAKKVNQVGLDSCFARVAFSKIHQEVQYHPQHIAASLFG